MSSLAVGIVSDTHGLIRPELIAALNGVSGIIHAGDIGRPDVLEELRRIAPVTAVRGNVDRDAWFNRVRETEVVLLGPSLSLYVLHDIARLDLDPKAAGFAAVVYGHSHKPCIRSKDGILYLNPGSAGPPPLFSACYLYPRRSFRKPPAC